ncbi:molybdopterin biosynthesis protein [Roseovarius sp. SCSIO 43702]|uniref:molybdopterin-binding protein n=1 Tax=Roseovarius sp. SCSIO 43702 TaxID=2823043 RepID=UPI001C7380BC|nr:molybdopterin-binding protein [Roseovarius sp. SCSIO 43702]QYX55284.1 molybdopterin biosynthesis protein [Roseovarius sp. SCSIO 43702]
MRFGPVPLAEAEGAILAHSERVAEGRLRKGVTLERAHLDALAAAGLREVTVARLEAGDVHEDAAARRLALALREGAEGLEATRARMGRVNLLAERAGLVVIDRAAVDAANAVDPVITVATVAPFHGLRAGGMAATVKIIAYAVPETALARAEAAARGAMRFATPRYGTATLIVTDSVGGPGLKGVDAIAQRLDGFDMTLTETRRTAHEIDALAEAIAAAEGDVVLILTGSATSDIRDTAPEALRRAGGEVTRFGIPVDPGNLSFTGRLGTRPVVGLPGSARSPVLHGADWVLGRVICDVGLSDSEMAAMGVGGLLKEMPSRPSPRRG